VSQELSTEAKYAAALAEEIYRRAGEDPYATGADGTRHGFERHRCQRQPASDHDAEPCRRADPGEHMRPAPPR
jgi:hypothetical protein